MIKRISVHIDIGMFCNFRHFIIQPFYSNFDGLIGTISIEIRFHRFYISNSITSKSIRNAYYINALQHAIAKINDSVSIFHFICRNTNLLSAFNVYAYIRRIHWWGNVLNYIWQDLNGYFVHL